jgi:transposase
VGGGDDRTGELFSYVDLEARVRRDHPLRTIRAIVNEALSALERDLAALYSPIGRPSIPPEKLLRAMVLQASYSIRSERLLVVFCVSSRTRWHSNIVVKVRSGVQVRGCPWPTVINDIST